MSRKLFKWTMLALLATGVQSMAAQWGPGDHHGCTDSTAVNFDPAATVDDGSCFYGDFVWGNDPGNLDSLLQGGGPFPGGGGPNPGDDNDNDADSTDLGIDHGGWDPDSIWNSGPGGWDPDSSSADGPGDNDNDDDSSYVDNNPGDSIWFDPHWPPFDSIDWTIDTVFFPAPGDSIDWNFPGDSTWVWPVPGDSVYTGGPIDSVWVFPFPVDSGWVNPGDSAFNGGFGGWHPHLNVLGEDSIPADVEFYNDWNNLEDDEDGDNGPDSLGVFHGNVPANPNQRLVNEGEVLQIMNVYPNPTLDNSRLVVQSAKDGMAMVRIFTLTGEIVGTHQMVCVAGVNQMQVDVSGLSSGTYLIQVNQGGVSRVVNLVKQ